MNKFTKITSEMIEHNYPVKERIFEPYSSYAVATKVSDSWWENNKFCLELTLSNLQKSHLKISLLEGGIINITYSQKQIMHNRFNEHIKILKSQELNVQNNENDYTFLLVNKEKLVIHKNPFQISLIDKYGDIKFETYDREGYQFLEGYMNPPLGYKLVGDDNSKPFLSLRLHNNEKIYGLGEKFRPLVKNGIESVIWNADTSCVANNDIAHNGLPLIYSTNKWGLLVNTGFRTTFEIGSPVTDAISILSEENCFDLCFFTGNSMKDLISQYTLLTGRISGVPDLAYGTWLNRLYYHNKEELMTEIHNAKEHNFPLDIITLDPKWLKDRYVKSCNFELNTNSFGDFEKLFSEVDKFGIKMCFWINPYIQGDNGNNYNELLNKNLLLKTIDGNYAHPFTGTETYQTNNYLIDFTKSEAQKWYKDQIKKLFGMGLRFVKPDYGEGTPANALFSNNKTGKDMKQFYNYLYTKIAYEASVEYFGKGEALVFCRPGYIGTQQFVGKWSGDSYSNFEELKIHLNAGLSLALSGEVIWGTDISGFKAIKEVDSDLHKRWTQVGMLTPLSRYHGIGPREPWYFGNDVLDNAIKFANFKRSLLPYFKQYELEAIQYGWPIIRPMVLENEDDNIARIIDDQYYLGSSLLICPILEPNTTKRQVYLPSGKWFKWDNKTEQFEGNRAYIFNCPSDEILIFVKSGSIIPLIKEEGYKFDDIDNITLDLQVYGHSDLVDHKIEFYLNKALTTILFKQEKIEVQSKFKYIVSDN